MSGLSPVYDSTQKDRKPPPRSPSRIVSLVPSLTHSLFVLGCGNRIVGRTDYCVHPADQVVSVPGVGGPKTPDIEAILQLKPDAVLMDREENRGEDAEVLQSAGIRIIAYLPRNLADVGIIVSHLLQVLDLDPGSRPGVQRLFDSLTKYNADHERPIPVFCPVWRNPWMSFNGDTYISDLLLHAGFENIFRSSPARYFSIQEGDLISRLSGDLLVLLPSEPYSFKDNQIQDIAHALQVRPEQCLLVPGEDLTWYGLITADALERISKIYATIFTP